MDRHELTELHYITPIANVPSILRLGILPYVRAQRVEHESVAMEEIQDRRARVAVVEILKRIEEEPFHWAVGRTTFQKIAYFATECGIPTGLKYHRGSYGPYAPVLKERITALVNNGLVREEQLGRMFAIRVGQTFSDARKAYEQQIRGWEQIIDKVADLFMRMNTNQAELAATVHFAAQEWKSRPDGGPTEKDLLDSVMKWKQKRRPPLDAKEVALTVRNLNMLSWIGAKASMDLPITEEDILHF